MNYTKILIKQDGAYALPEVPRMPLISDKEYQRYDGAGVRLKERKAFSKDMQRYYALHQQALDNAVKFRDREVRKHFFEFDGVLQDGLFDCPSGFEIVIENGYATLKNIK